MPWARAARRCARTPDGVEGGVGPGEGIVVGLVAIDDRHPDRHRPEPTASHRSVERPAEAEGLLLVGHCQHGGELVTADAEEALPFGQAVAERRRQVLQQTVTGRPIM